MTRPIPRRKARKTLRQALRDLLRRNPTIQADQTSIHTIGSGILKKASNPVPQLPNFSTVSVFPDFDTIQNDIPRLLPGVPTSSCASMGSSNPKRTNAGKHLLPSRSISSLNTTYFEASGSRKIAYDAVPSVYQEGLSRQASLVSTIRTSATTLARPPSAPSLRIRNSRASLRPNEKNVRSTDSQTRTPGHLQRSFHQPPAQSSGLKRASTRQRVSEDWARTHQEPLNPRAVDRSASVQATSHSPASPHPMTLVEHFKCFVILDTAQPGCPVTGTSSDLRYIFEIGEQFVLNNSECEGMSMDMTSGKDAAGNPVVHLLLFTPLINATSGRSRFMLVALVDVTNFIMESASQVPELDTISEEASVTDEAATPPVQQSPHWSSVSHTLSADDLLGGCSLPGDEDDFPLGSKQVNEDIWLALAATDGGLKSHRSTGHPPVQPSPTSSSRSTPTAPSHASLTDDVLEDFMSSLQELYSDMFVLGSSPLADDAYEICNVSPRVYESKDYIEGHLSHTPAPEIERLSRKLGQLDSFRMKVRWGMQGQEKQLYCSPLYAGSSITWICYLVDAQLPKLW